MPGQPLVLKLERFAPLTEEDKTFLREACIGHLKTVSRKHDIISEDDKPERVHLLVEGWAARYKMLPDGSRAIMAYLIPGDLCDVHTALLNRMDHSIMALSDCRVCFISREKIKQIFFENGRIARAFFWATLVDEAILREWLVNIGRRDANHRLAHLLCEMLLRSKAVGLTENNSFRMPINQSELADTMGMSIVHVNRMLKELRERGLVTVEGADVHIHDLDSLFGFVDYNPNYLHLEPHTG